MDQLPPFAPPLLPRRVPPLALPPVSTQDTNSAVVWTNLDPFSSNAEPYHPAPYAQPDLAIALGLDVSGHSSLYDPSDPSWLVEAGPTTYDIPSTQPTFPTDATTDLVNPARAPVRAKRPSVSSTSSGDSGDRQDDLAAGERGVKARTSFRKRGKTKSGAYVATNLAHVPKAPNTSRYPLPAWSTVSPGQRVVHPAPSPSVHAFSARISKPIPGPISTGYSSAPASVNPSKGVYALSAQPQRGAKSASVSLGRASGRRASVKPAPSSYDMPAPLERRHSVPVLPSSAIAAVQDESGSTPLVEHQPMDTPASTTCTTMLPPWTGEIPSASQSEAVPRILQQREDLFAYTPLAPRTSLLPPHAYSGIPSPYTSWSAPTSSPATAPPFFQVPHLERRWSSPCFAPPHAPTLAAASHSAGHTTIGHPAASQPAPSPAPGVPQVYPALGPPAQRAPLASDHLATYGQVNVRDSSFVPPSIAMYPPAPNAPAPIAGVDAAPKGSPVPVIPRYSTVQAAEIALGLDPSAFCPVEFDVSRMFGSSTYALDPLQFVFGPLATPTHPPMPKIPYQQVAPPDVSVYTTPRIPPSIPTSVIFSNIPNATSGAKGRGAAQQPPLVEQAVIKMEEVAVLPTPYISSVAPGQFP